jgi:diguanylate cyclase (GGDEF)-like protein
MPYTTGLPDEESIRAARVALVRASSAVTRSALVVTGIAAFGGSLLASLLSADPLADAMFTAVMALALVMPFWVVVAIRMRRLASISESLSDARQQQVDEAGRRQEFTTVVADALDMAETETEALQVIERTFAAVLPHQPVELLLADNSHAHLTRVAFTAPDGEIPGCGVGSPRDCPAARRARVQDFPDSDAVNACPKLQGRSVGRCAAVCIPVSMMGRTVGVIHTVTPFGTSIQPAERTDLQSIAAQAGTRLGMLRILAETQLQATTDGLTGLMNRRALENDYLQLLDNSAVTSVAMADLDHFKQLNDTYGHATGDRALRTFAQTLQSALRAEDLVSRRGGEEFAIVFPNCDAQAAVAGLQRVQTQLQVALNLAGLPTYTASFGVVEALLEEDFETTLIRADVALFAAKSNGRDRITVHDHRGIEAVPPARSIANDVTESPHAATANDLTTLDPSQR